MRELRVSKVGEVNHLSFSPDGRLLAVASELSNIRLWDVASGKPARVLPGTKGSDQAHFTRGGAILTSPHGAVQLWPAGGRTPQVVPTTRIGPDSIELNCIELAVSPDGTCFVSMDRDIGPKEL